MSAFGDATRSCLCIVEHDVEQVVSITVDIVKMFAKTYLLLLLSELSLAIRVFVHPSPLSKASVPPVLLPSQARAVVSYQLGLDAFDSFGDVSEPLNRLFSERPFVGKGAICAILLTISEDVSRDAIPSSLNPSFFISNPPAASSEMSLVVSSYVQRAKHVYTNVYTLESVSSLQVPRLVDLFPASTSSATETFLAESSQLVSLIESEEADTFGAYELSGLSKILAEYGRSSEQFKLAAETTRAILASAQEHSRLSLVVLTYPEAKLSRRQNAQPPQQSPFPPPSPSPQLPIGGVVTCHVSVGACANATNECSGRGECVQASKAGKTCFVCACEVTEDSKGRKDYWVGDACERKDISAPFVLITGTVIAVILIIFGSVSLLYSIGDQKLPPVLTASAVGHVKRD